MESWGLWRSKVCALFLHLQLFTLPDTWQGEGSTGWESLLCGPQQGLVTLQVGVSSRLHSPERWVSFPLCVGR